MRGVKTWSSGFRPKCRTRIAVAVNSVTTAAHASTLRRAGDLVTRKRYDNALLFPPLHVVISSGETCLGENAHTVAADAAIDDHHANGIVGPRGVPVGEVRRGDDHHRRLRRVLERGEMGWRPTPLTTIRGTNSTIDAAKPISPMSPLNNLTNRERRCVGLLGFGCLRRFERFFPMLRHRAGEEEAILELHAQFVRDLRHEHFGHAGLAICQHLAVSDQRIP